MRFLGKNHYLNKHLFWVITRALNLPDASQSHISLWKKLKTSVSVWIVNGQVVRSVFDKSFFKGGNDYEYEFIPLKEVWIDEAVEENERLFILLHELHERNLMAKGWSRDKAHNEACLIEDQCRHFPKDLCGALTKENWEI